MPGSSFGQAFRVTTAGESHGPANVVVIDGCPPGLPLDELDLVAELSRRRPGQSAVTTQRMESDRPEILSGVFEGKTTGTSLAILVRNADARSGDYEPLRHTYRPGHADHAYAVKFGHRDPRGGGRASARETVARVAAGAVAKKLLAAAFGGEVTGWVRQIGLVEAMIDPEVVRARDVEELSNGEPNIVRCPDHAAALRMLASIEEARAHGDSLGGIAEIAARGVPAGLGEPVFDKLKADLAKALFSIPAVLGVEFGSGFRGAAMRGSEHNDRFVPGDTITTATNHHGGILGGISSGMPIVARAAVKPTSSLPREQATVDEHGAPASVTVRGRHDPCVLPRFVPIAEAMMALVLADHWIRWKGQRGALG
ncbi:MAG: chorismate synthase [Deltaproteobacteria bacterium]|nr:chorismate synthase [Deltaproteobacteria bacterium]